MLTLYCIYSAAKAYRFKVLCNQPGWHKSCLAKQVKCNGGLKRDPLEFRNLEGDVPGSGSEITAVMAAAVALALLIALVPGRLGQFLRLGLQQLIEGFLCAASNSSLSWPLILPRLPVQSSRT